MNEDAALVLLPGLDGTGDLFAPLCAALAACPAMRITPQIVRYPGHTVLDYQGLAPLARAACPSDRPFYLLGESFSGPLALQLAAQSPAGLRGVILCASFIRNPHPHAARIAPLATLLPIQLAPPSLMSFALLGQYSTPPLRAALAQAVRQASHTVLRQRLLSVTKIDVSQELRQLRVPLLYLQASQDRIVPARAWREIHALQPLAHKVSVAAPHCLLQAAPQAAAAALLDFFQHCTAQQAST
ncbi:alpha/beta fold hydrolase [Massilia sp. W12]|uniref:alpha/beta fold hydrolase n=1 Tax=Massilia sp. W12 TaxID=3126507 RepID=UPI0030D55EBA